MKRLVSLLPLLILVTIGCSEQNAGPTADNSLIEYDEGLSLKVVSQAATSSIEIRFNMPSSGSYTLSVLNVTGYTIRAWQGTASAGQVGVVWDATNEDGTTVEVGLYIYELEAGGLTARKVDLLGGLGS